jgi:hypothetical protein
LFRRFLLAWRIAREIPYNKDLLLSWDDSDRQWLLSISQSRSGRKLFAELHNQIGETAVWATTRNDSVRSCGYAAGVAYLVNLIDACLPQKDKPALEEEEADIFESITQ